MRSTLNKKYASNDGRLESFFKLAATAQGAVLWINYFGNSDPMSFLIDSEKFLFKKYTYSEIKYSLAKNNTTYLIQQENTYLLQQKKCIRYEYIIVLLYTFGIFRVGNTEPVLRYISIFSNKYRCLFENMDIGYTYINIGVWYSEKKYPLVIRYIGFI